MSKEPKKPKRLKQVIEYLENTPFVKNRFKCLLDEALEHLVAKKFISNDHIAAISSFPLEDFYAVDVLSAFYKTGEVNFKLYDLLFGRLLESTDYKSRNSISAYLDSIGLFSKYNEDLKKEGFYTVFKDNPIN